MVATKTRIVNVLAVCFLLTCAAADAATWTSQRGTFVVSYRSALQPIEINKLHSWLIHIENAAGEAVVGASIEVSGGMPAHNHGLPTRPRVTAELGGGDYKLNGMRFHMAGEWEVTLVITADGVTDNVVIALTL
jgi:hypothetical protein